ncbi:unnamed protein product [Nesidiocoris tenuis]|uniref:Uncharacterized protein n=1 Tax=Nesidiocoris tenuis TaxID=355587 RepID=A0A6H5GHJ5_9HEMI|nr:unnamed protein product [Nesidiocoris tenuis]
MFVWPRSTTSFNHNFAALQADTIGPHRGANTFYSMPHERVPRENLLISWRQLLGSFLQRN